MSAPSGPQEIVLQVGSATAAKPAAAQKAPLVVPDSPFVRDLVSLLRAGDSYGRLDRFSDGALLRPFVLSSADRAKISVDCEVEAVIVERVRTFYQAAAAGIERATDLMSSVVIDLSHEGFGRGAVLTGRLVAVSDTLRDLQRFGFGDLAALATAGEKIVARGIATVTKYPEVARDDA